MLHVQDSSKPIFNADSEFVSLLLTFVANKIEQEVACVRGAHNIFIYYARTQGYAPSASVWMVQLTHCLSHHLYAS